MGDKWDFFFSSGVGVLLRAGGFISSRNVLVLRNFDSVGILPLVKNKLSVVYIHRENTFFILCSYVHIILMYNMWVRLKY